MDGSKQSVEGVWPGTRVLHGDQEVCSVMRLWRPRGGPGAAPPPSRVFPIHHRSSKNPHLTTWRSRQDFSEPIGGGMARRAEPAQVLLKEREEEPGHTCVEDMAAAKGDRAEEREKLLDSGLRFYPSGGLAYCLRQNEGSLWPVCPACLRICSEMSPWSRCPECRTLIYRASAEQRGPQEYVVQRLDGRLCLSREKEPVVVPCPPRPECEGLWDVSSPVTGSEFPHGVPPSRYYPMGCRSVMSTPHGTTSSVSVSREWPSMTRAESGEKLTSSFSVLNLSPAPSVGQPWLSEVVPESSLPVVPTEGIESELQSAEELSAGSGTVSGGGERLPDGSGESGAPGAPEDRLVARDWGLARARRALNPYLPRGRGLREELPRMSRLQRFFTRHVALEYGWEFPYVTEELFDHLEERRVAIYQQCVWEHMGVPKPQRRLTEDNPYRAHFDRVYQEFTYGRHIHNDRVVLCRPGAEDSVKIATDTDPRTGQEKQYPDPRYYEL